jgi:hypothetical protein
MFLTPEPLNRATHARLRLSTTPDYRFAAGQIATPIVSGEMWPIAREYIMVFPHEIGLPLAILGTQSGVNAYLGDGNPPWWGRYVPAHLRRYPFIAAPRPPEEQDSDEKQHFTVFIDTAAPQLSTTSGQPLFDDHGQPSALLTQVQTALASLQADFTLTQTLVKQIADADLLVDKALTIKPLDEEPLGLTGFRIVDQKKLREAAPELLAELIKTRALDLVYAHIGSLSNLQDGLLAKKARGEISVGTTDQPALDLENIMAAMDSDIFKFN